MPRSLAAHDCIHDRSVRRHWRGHRRPHSQLGDVRPACFAGQRLLSPAPVALRAPVAGHGQTPLSPPTSTIRPDSHFRWLEKASPVTVYDAVWKSNPGLRADFPDYAQTQDGEILSPYAAFPPLETDGRTVLVAEGAGAIRAHEAMMCGVERDDPELSVAMVKLNGFKKTFKPREYLRFGPRPTHHPVQ